MVETHETRANRGPHHTPSLLLSHVSHTIHHGLDTIHHTIAPW